jgi:histidinol-phosphate aminotransferase
VILDEAYCEFSLTLGDTYASLELLRKYPNVVLLRTFSKVYGLAALRVGYALCGAEDFRVAVDQVRQPFYLNAAAQAAAVEALRHQDAVEQRVTETIAGRLEMEDAVRALGLWVARSDANFIWLHLPETVEEADVVSGLRDRGILVRAGAALGRERSLRVTVGTDAENERFASALAAVL